MSIFVLVYIHNNVVFVVAKPPSAVEKLQDIFYQLHGVGLIFITSFRRVDNEYSHW